MSSKLVKQCEICGATFTPKNANTKYCGAICREKAAKKHRKEWELKNNYKESQRLRMREVRRNNSKELKKANIEADRKERERRQQESEQRAKKRKKELLKRVADSETFAKLILEQQTNGRRTTEYWELYRQYEIEQAEAQNKSATAMINGIPIISDSFAPAVVLSIEASGVIIKS